MGNRENTMNITGIQPYYFDRRFVPADKKEKRGSGFDKVLEAEQQRLESETDIRSDKK